jgi:hypothetical protein
MFDFILFEFKNKSCDSSVGIATRLRDEWEFFSHRHVQNGSGAH